MFLIRYVMAALLIIVVGLGVSQAVKGDESILIPERKLVPFKDMTDSQKLEQAVRYLNARPPSRLLNTIVLRFVTKDDVSLMCALDTVTDAGNCFRLSAIASQYTELEHVIKYVEDNEITVEDAPEPGPDEESI